MPNMSIYVSMETFIKITELAQKNGLTPSMQARRLIEEALKKPVKAATTTQHETDAKEGTKEIKSAQRKKSEAA